MAAQAGYATESVYGTPVTVTSFVPLVSESLTQEIERIESEGIIAGARLLRSEQWAPGNVTVEGEIQHELFQQGAGVLFKHMFGAVNTTGAGPYTHTFTPGDLTGDGFTTQLGRPRADGTVQPFTYSGCKVQSWEIALEAGQNATLGINVVGQQEDDATALATASYVTGGATPFNFRHGTVTIGGAAAKVRAITLSGENTLSTDRRILGQAYVDEPLEAGLRNISGEITIEFLNMTQRDHFVDGDEFAVVLDLDAGASASLTFTLNARYDGHPANVEGRDLIVVNVPFKVIGTTTDAAGITAVMVNNQTTV
jgi:hypothetical protein